jgi:hypothetical protein
MNGGFRRLKNAESFVDIEPSIGRKKQQIETEKKAA